jgi:MFS superfamily sulfate permease-like transporter
VLPGILVAVALAIVKLRTLASRPGEAILGEVPGQEGYHEVTGHPGARTVPGLLIYRFDAAPLFFNADYLKERVRTVVAAGPARPTWFLYSAEAANVLDFTGAEALEQIRSELAAQGIVLAIARPRGLFEVMLRRTGLAERVGAEYLFPTVRSGVQAYLDRQPRGATPR